MGGFSAKNEKNKYIFWKKKKSLFYKTALTFFLGGLEKKLWALLYFFYGTPWGASEGGQNGFLSQKNENFIFFIP